VKRVNADHVIIFGISIPGDGLEGSELEIWNLDNVTSTALSLSLRDFFITRFF
jgi:hypothetical protein